MSPRDELVELEIGAFMGPHIKRARILLAVVGALYLYAGWRDYSGVADARALIARYQQAGGHDLGLDRAQHLVNLAYALVIAALVAGVANLVLAAIAGTWTMVAFYIAVAIFAAHSLLQVYASGGLLLTNLEWWLAVIILGMGFTAARKAERLRASAAAGAAAAAPAGV